MVQLHTYSVDEHGVKGKAKCHFVCFLDKYMYIPSYNSRMRKTDFFWNCIFKKNLFSLTGINAMRFLFEATKQKIAWNLVPPSTVAHVK